MRGRGGTGSDKAQIVGSLDMSSSLHQTKDGTEMCSFYVVAQLSGPPHTCVRGGLLLSQLSRFQAETGQQTHKHGAGRCYALHPAPCADAAARRRKH